MIIALNINFGVTEKLMGKIHRLVYKEIDENVGVMLSGS